MATQEYVAPRLYKRVSGDEIETDKFLQAAASGFSNWTKLHFNNKKLLEMLELAFDDLYNEFGSDLLTSSARGGFYGSKYKNAKKGFDAYGLVAGYFNDVLKQQLAYKDPRTEFDRDNFKVSFDPTTELGDISEFYKMDKEDENGKRGVSARTTALIDKLKDKWLKDKYNYRFNNEDDEKYYDQILQDIIGTIGGGDTPYIDENEFWTLSNKYGLNGLSSWFATELNPVSRNKEGLSFAQYVDRNNPYWNGTWSKTLLKYSGDENIFNDARLRIYNYLDSNGDSGINDAIQSLKLIISGAVDLHGNLFLISGSHQTTLGLKAWNGSTYGSTYGPQYFAHDILKYLIERGYAEDVGNGNYYIKNWNNNHDGAKTVYIYNPKTRLLQELSEHMIPSIRQGIMQSWGGSSPTTNHWTTTLYPEMYPAHKHGGSIKKLEQGGNPRKKLSELEDFDESGYETSYRTNTRINPYFGDDDYEEWTSSINITDKNGNNTGRYKNSKKEWERIFKTFGYLNTNDYFNNDNLSQKGIDEISKIAKKVEESPQYLQFIDDLSKDSELRESFMKHYDAALPSHMRHLSFYDDNGNLRDQWTASGNGTFGTGPVTYTNAWERLKALMTDHFIGNAHNIYGKQVTKYYYTDADGNKHWVSPDDAKNYNNTLTSEGYNGDIYEYLYELNESPTENPQEETTSENQPENDTLGNLLLTTTPKEKKSAPDINWNKLATNLLGASRLVGTLRTNNKVYDKMRASLKPVLEKTWEFPVPVVGDLDKRNYYHNESADVLNQGDHFKTSDRDWNEARALDRDVAASKLRLQGDLAYDLGIRETLKEQKAEQKDFIKRLTELENKNMLSINKNNQILAQLDATRTKANWERGVDPYLKGIEANILSKESKRQAYRENILTEQLKLEYKKDIAKLLNKYLKPGMSVYDLVDIPEYVSEYETLVSNFKQKLNKELLQIARNGLKLKYNANNS